MSSHVKGRPNMNFSESVVVKVHPDMLAFVQHQAETNYQTVPEYIRGLIVAKMREGAA